MRMNKDKEDKVALVPKLRFPEFHSMGEWEISTLSSLASRITVRNQENLINRVLTNSAVEGVVDQSDYFDREVANQNNLENYFVINEGDYVYNPRISATAPVGPISKNKVGRGVMSPLYTVFRFENPNNDFYEQYFKTNLWHAYLKSVSNTGARHDRMSISNGNFMKMPLPYPSEGEQQKIADCLSSLDDLITAEDKKLEALKAHKKGLMQKLFPAKGATVPEWRFPEFRDSGEWEERKLGDVCTSIISGKSKKSTGNGIFPLIGSTGQIGFCDTADYSGELILIARVGANAGQVNFYTGKCGVSDNTLILNVDTANIIGLFLRKWLDNFNINKLIFGSGQPLVTGGQLKNIDICIPRLTEQQKIADFLSGLDDLITSQAEKIEAMKAHKKGLMQGLFPSDEEVGE